MQVSLTTSGDLFPPRSNPLKPEKVSWYLKWCWRLVIQSMCVPCAGHNFLAAVDTNCSNFTHHFPCKDQRRAHGTTSNDSVISGQWAVISFSGRNPKTTLVLSFQPLPSSVFWCKNVLGTLPCVAREILVLACLWGHPCVKLPCHSVAGFQKGQVSVVALALRAAHCSPWVVCVLSTSTSWAITE